MTIFKHSLLTLSLLTSLFSSLALASKTRCDHALNKGLVESHMAPNQEQGWVPTHKLQDFEGGAIWEAKGVTNGAKRVQIYLFNNIEDAMRMSKAYDQLGVEVGLRAHDLAVRLDQNISPQAKEDEPYFIVFELSEGKHLSRSLVERTESNLLQLRKALDILIATIPALEFANSLGVHHGGITENDLLIQEDASAETPLKVIISGFSVPSEQAKPETQLTDIKKLLQILENISPKNIENKRLAKEFTQFMNKSKTSSHATLAALKQNLLNLRSITFEIEQNKRATLLEGRTKKAGIVAVVGAAMLSFYALFSPSEVKPQESAVPNTASEVRAMPEPVTEIAQPPVQGPIQFQPVTETPAAPPVPAVRTRIENEKLRAILEHLNDSSDATTRKAYVLEQIEALLHEDRLVRSDVPTQFDLIDAKLFLRQLRPLLTNNIETYHQIVGKTLESFLDDNALTLDAALEFREFVTDLDANNEIVKQIYKAFASTLTINDIDKLVSSCQSKNDYKEQAKNWLKDRSPDLFHTWVYSVRDDILTDYVNRNRATLTEDEKIRLADKAECELAKKEIFKQ